MRLCDGYFWPISSAATRSELSRDRSICERSCGSPVALYHDSNSEGELQDMTSLDGEPYTKLRNAFLYRTTYNADCKCKPHPWEKEAIERHQSYAHGPTDPSEKTEGRN